MPRRDCNPGNRREAITYICDVTRETLSLIVHRPQHSEANAPDPGRHPKHSRPIRRREVTRSRFVDEATAAVDGQSSEIVRCERTETAYSSGGPRGSRQSSVLYSYMSTMTEMIGTLKRSSPPPRTTV